MLNLDILSSVQILSQNPVLEAAENTKYNYFYYLLKYIRLTGWQRRKYVKAQLSAYAERLTGNEKVDFRTIKKPDGLSQKFISYLVFDMCSVLGYDKQFLSSEKMDIALGAYYSDFHIGTKDQKAVAAVIDAVCGDENKWKQIQSDKINKAYVTCFRNNLQFMKQRPYKILVTATMSAGKSTFINALVGKNISLVQNMACTSKIHSIVGKLFEDNFCYEYDHDLAMNAEKEELLEDNKSNLSKKIWVSTFFQGELAGSRIIINDSPGVNFSENQEHKEITERILRSKDFNLLIFLMNATQLGTNDNDQHLDFVKSIIGRKPVLFIVNKIDAFNSEEEDVYQVLEKQVQYLKAKGFKNPIVCPVSSIAGYLSKKSMDNQLSRVESRELYCRIDEFDKMKLPEFYSKYYPEIKIRDEDTEEIQLQKTCGLKYIESMIKIYSTGGKVNGTGLC